MAVMDYVNELKRQREILADILTEKGVAASHDEKFNTLIPKVRNISGGSYEIENAYIAIVSGIPSAVKNTVDSISTGEFENAIFEEE